MAKSGVDVEMAISTAPKPIVDGQTAKQNSPAVVVERG